MQYFVDHARQCDRVMNSASSPRERMGKGLVAILGLFAAFALCDGEIAMAQTAHFSGAQTYVAAGGSNIQSIAVDAKGNVFFTAQNGLGPGSLLFASFAGSNTVYQVNGFNAPLGVVVDDAGDLFVADAGSGTIGEIVAVNGSIPATASPSIVTLVSGINSPADLAIDAQRNLYFTSIALNTVNEILAVNGSIPPSPTIRTLGSGFKTPVGVAVDGLGNVYVADAQNNAVKELVAVNGTIPATPTILTLGSGFAQPEGIALDANGDLYVSDSLNNELKEIVAVNGSIPSSPTIINLGRYMSTAAVAVGGIGNLYVGSGNNPNGGIVSKLSLANANFGQTNVGSVQNAISMTYTFDTAGTLGSVAVMTQGVTGLDFANAGSGNCTANTAYNSGETCTVNVTFNPAFPGTRYGAAILQDVSGNAIATGYLQGTGVGPQIDFLPGAQSTIPLTGPLTPTGLAVDGGGNLYTFAETGDALFKETLSANTYTQSTIASGLSIAWAVTVDGSGNVYVTDTGNQRVLKETPTAAGYIQSTVTSLSGYPYGLAVDGSGNLYVSVQYTNGAGAVVMKETASAGGYTQSTVVSGLVAPLGIAVDESDNLYIADVNNGSGILLKETFSPSGYVQSALPTTGNIQSPIAVDGIGNVYFVDQNSNVLKDTLTSSGYVLNAVVGPPVAANPYSIAVDAGGNLYVGYIGFVGNNSVAKVDFSSPPILNFASTPPGTTSADSPQTVTIENAGNAPLTFPVPASGNNPSVATNFTLDSSGASACPLVSSASSTAGTLAAGATCAMPISYTPTVSGPVSGALTVTDNTLNAAGPAYASQAVVLNGTNISPSFTLSSSSSSLILNLSSSTTTTITVTPQAGFVVNASLSVSGLPNGVTASFSPNPTTGTSTLTLTSDNTITTGTATVVITGVYGPQTASTSISLKTNGPAPYFTLSVSPAPLTIPRGGSATSTISVTGFNGFSGIVTLLANTNPGVTASFSPSSTSGTSIMTLSASTSAFWGVPQWVQIQGFSGGLSDAVSISVTVKLVPVITWPTPPPITYGTALSATQLNASANVSGTFTYSPAAGTVLSPGAQTLTATFTPTDTADYATTTATVSLTVNKATPVISWATPTPIAYGAALGAAQLNASANVPGTFAYSPAAGTVLSAGTQALLATFTPTDTTNYSSTSGTVALIVNKAVPVISWNTPAPITYGTALSTLQLNATANVPGSFVYNPTAGTVPPVGTDTLSATFTPTDTKDYASVSSSVILTVNPAPNFTLSASPSVLSLAQNGSITCTISVADVGGFTGSVKLAVSGLPSGVTASFSTNPTTRTSDLTLKASPKASTGNATVTVTGTSGTLAQSTVITLTVVARK